VVTHEQLADEALRARRVRQIVDISTSLIVQSNLTRREAETLVDTVRRRILELFPDGEETYELIYMPRFRRLIDEYAATADDHRGVVLTFRPGAP
jgi:hypothetical protein